MGWGWRNQQKILQTPGLTQRDRLRIDNQNPCETPNGTSSGHIDRNRQPYCSDILIFRIFHDLHFELLKGSPMKKYWMSTPAIYQRHGKGIKPLDVLTRFPKLGCLQLSVSQAACFNHFNPKVSAVNSKSRKGRMGFGSGEVS